MAVNAVEKFAKWSLPVRQRVEEEEDEELAARRNQRQCRQSKHKSLNIIFAYVLSVFVYLRFRSIGKKKSICDVVFPFDFLHFMALGLRIVGSQVLNIVKCVLPECFLNRKGFPGFDVREYFEKNEKASLYTVDAMLKGNIGRFFNHSCDPNIGTQPVFVDTHDLRLNWVAFFAIKNMKAGEVSRKFLF